jgi:hypothetical protein
MARPDTWAVVAYFVLVAWGIMFSLAGREGSPSMWHLPKSKSKRAALMSIALPTALTIFNRPDREAICVLVLLSLIFAAYGLSDFLKCERRNIPAFCLWFVLASGLVSLTAVHFWPTLYSVELEWGETIYDTPGTNQILFAEQDHKLHPVTALIFARIRNTQPTAAMIVDYAINLKIDGGWKRLRQFDMSSMHAVIGDEAVGFKSVTGEFLNSATWNHNIGPGEYVRGWITASCLPPPEQISDHIFRLTILDASGHVYDTDALHAVQTPTSYWTAITSSAALLDKSEFKIIPEKCN